jgi:hypothetical protein
MSLNGGTQQVQLPVSLRGTLAQEYVILNEQNAGKATVWLRQLVGDALKGDVSLRVLVQLTKATGHKRYIIGRRDEVGRYPPDW